MDDPVQDATLAGIGANGPPTFIPVDHDPFMLPGEPQRESRRTILNRGLDTLKDYLVPSYLRDTPSSPEADRALADPDTKPGKIGPPSGPPTVAQIVGGLGADVGASLIPAEKLAVTLTPAMKAALASGRSYSDVGREFGLTRNQIASALYRDRQIEAGVARPRSERPDYFWEQNPDLAAQAKQLSDEGVSLGEIAKRLNVTRGAVAGRLWRALPPETTAVSSQWVKLPDGTLQRLTGDPEAIKRLRPVDHDPFHTLPVDHDPFERQ